MAVRIIVDSTADMMPHVRQRLTVVPLTVHFGAEEFLDGVTITHREFYEKLVECDTLPTTSQVSPAVFEDVFAKVTAEGDSAVVITIASQLSGTCQSALIAAENYPNIFVVDSGTTTLGAGILAELALQLADSGCDAAAIADRLSEERAHIRIVALLDTLEYLKKGGRISKTVAFAGGLLNIKPVISLEQGQICMLGKARGSRQGNNLLVTEIQKAGGVDFSKPLLLGYSGLSDALLQKYIADSSALWAQVKTELPFTCVGSVIGTHAGPGAVAVAFFAKL